MKESLVEKDEDIERSENAEFWETDEKVQLNKKAEDYTGDHALKSK